MVPSRARAHSVGIYLSFSELFSSFFVLLSGPGSSECLPPLRPRPRPLSRKFGPHQCPLLRSAPGVLQCPLGPYNISHSDNTNTLGLAWYRPGLGYRARAGARAGAMTGAGAGAGPGLGLGLGLGYMYVSPNYDIPLKLCGTHVCTLKQFFHEVIKYIFLTNDNIFFIN